MNYVAPEMEVLEVMVECGFAGSGEGANAGGLGNEEEII